MIAIAEQAHAPHLVVWQRSSEACISGLTEVKGKIFPYPQRLDLLSCSSYAPGRHDRSSVELVLGLSNHVVVLPGKP